MSTTIKERVKSLIGSSRSYHASDTHANGVTKTWNNGMGRLDLCHVDEELGVVFINCRLASKRDKERILEASPDFTPYYVEYGYPDYNYHSFLGVARKLYKETQS